MTTTDDSMSSPLGHGSHRPARQFGVRTISLRSSIGALTAGLIVLLVLIAAAGAVGRLQVAAAAKVLTAQVLPAQSAVAELTKAYVDQETGQRGYLLTGDPQLLQPFNAGVLEATRLHRELDVLLSDRDDARLLVHKVRSAATTWQTHSALPEIQQRADGPIAPNRLERYARDGKTQFDDLRNQLANLQQWTHLATEAQLDAIAHAQRIANAITISAVLLALLGGLLSIPFTRRLVTRPLNQLVDQVGVVSNGDHHQPIMPCGPAELVCIGSAVENMRINMIHSAQIIQEAERELTLQREQERLATQLHDLTIQRLFGLSLRLSSLTQRYPKIRDDVLPLIHETDRTIHEMQSVIFDARHDQDSVNSRAQLMKTIDKGAANLPFDPIVEFSGPIDEHAIGEVASELRAIIEQSLNAISGRDTITAATIRIEAAEDTIVLTITDNDGAPSADVLAGHYLTQLRDRARQRGGSVAARAARAGGTEVIWKIPAPRDSSG
jgi:CHASE3 domain sensor protein